MPVRHRARHPTTRRPRKKVVGVRAFIRSVGRDSVLVVSDSVANGFGFSGFDNRQAFRNALAPFRERGNGVVHCAQGVAQLVEHLYDVGVVAASWLTHGPALP